MIDDDKVISDAYFRCCCCCSFIQFQLDVKHQKLNRREHMICFEDFSFHFDYKREMRSHSSSQMDGYLMDRQVRVEFNFGIKVRTALNKYGSFQIFT